MRPVCAGQIHFTHHFLQGISIKIRSTQLKIWIHLCITEKTTSPGMINQCIGSPNSANEPENLGSRSQWKRRKAWQWGSWDLVPEHWLWALVAHAVMLSLRQFVWRRLQKVPSSCLAGRSWYGTSVLFTDFTNHMTSSTTLKSVLFRWGVDRATMAPSNSVPFPVLMVVGLKASSSFQNFTHRTWKQTLFPYRQ